MDTGNIGAQLRSAREAHGVSLGSMAQRTRVQPRILTAIEENDIRSIPPKPFGRGFVRAYAREIGLDPERTVHDYFSQFPPVVQETPKAQGYESTRTPSWIVPLGGIAVLVVLIAVGLRGGEPATDQGPAPDAVGTSGTSSSTPAPQPEATSAAAPAPAPVTQPAATASSLNVVLTLTSPSWVTATADGKRAIYQLMAPGAKQSLAATREVTVLAGNAGGVELTINGRAAGNVGRPGEVRTIRINLQNANTIGTPR